MINLTERLLVFLFVGLITFTAWAQEPEPDEEEEDFSMYADAELADGAKRFCTNKVLDQSPNKLISIGYDFQGAHDMTIGAWGSIPSTTVRVNQVSGIRINGNVPVISKTNMLLNVGYSYWEANYTMAQSSDNPFVNTLDTRGLRTAGILATFFKPLNEKQFFLIQAQADLNGDYFLPDFQPLSYLKYSGAAVYGWKKHDRLFYGFGMSRTYRIGEVNYVPIMLYNYTFPSRKWGIESALPVRAQLRRNFNPRTLAFFGYELEGQSYRISNIEGINGVKDPELRRSELRIRLTFERSLKDFIWISAQAGLRYNWNFNVDEGDFFRGFFGEQPYLLENSLTNAMYFNVSINLVSP